MKFFGRPKTDANIPGPGGMIDIHSHILPAIDDGARDLDEALAMARIALADGICVMVATPHLFNPSSEISLEVNDKQKVLEHLTRFQEKLTEEKIPLMVLPGCDFPLNQEAIRLLEEDRVLTINDRKRYLLLELSPYAIPSRMGDICFRLQAKGLTPIITHPERHPLIQEKPERLVEMLDLGCLVQLTANSLTGGFGRQIARFSRDLVRKGYVHLIASDAHSVRHRPPVLSKALKELTALVGSEKAWEMVSGLPEKIINGEPLTA